MRIAALAAIVLAPLIIAPGVSFYYDVTPKILVLLFCAACALAIAAWRPDYFGALMQSRYGRWLIGLSIASLVCGAAASLLSAHPELAWHGSNWRRWGWIPQSAATALALVAAASLARSPATLPIWLRTIALSGLIPALYGIAQYFGADLISTAAQYQAGEGPFQIVRPPGTLGHSSYFAAFLLWPLFASCSLPVTEKIRPWRIAAICLAMAQAVAVILTGSRGALLGLLVGTVCFAVLAKARRVSLLIAATALLAGFAVLYLSPAGQRLRARAHWISEDWLAAPACCCGGIRFAWRRIIRSPGMGLTHSSRRFRHSPRENSLDLIRISIMSRRITFCWTRSPKQGCLACSSWRQSWRLAYERRWLHRRLSRPSHWR